MFKCIVERLAVIGNQYFTNCYQYIITIKRDKNLTIKRDKVSRHLLSFASDVLQRSILGPLHFLIHINNLYDVVALAIKQRYVHAHVCSHISGN